jgi:SAM-dependent methyltransferase
MDRAIYRSMRSLQGEHWWFRARREILGTVIGGLGLRPGARILEAGCGPGGNIALLQRFGDVSAFDMDAEAGGFCRADTGVACAIGSLPDANPFQDARSFDLVVALDVLEHIQDDRASLLSLASTLAEGGRLLVTVPAYQWMFSSHDVVHHHKRRYSRPQLQRLFAELGFEIVRDGYFNSLLFPIVAVARLHARLFHRGTTGDSMPPRWLNSLLERVFGLESKVLARGAFPFGTSIFLVATRTRATG